MGEPKRWCSSQKTPQKPPESGGSPLPKCAHSLKTQDQGDIGGVGWAQKNVELKYSGSWSMVAKIANIGPPGAPQKFFHKKIQDSKSRDTDSYTAYTGAIFFFNFFGENQKCS